VGALYILSTHTIAELQINLTALTSKRFLTEFVKFNICEF